MNHSNFGRPKMCKKNQANPSHRKSILRKCCLQSQWVPAKMHDRKVIIIACLHAQTHVLSHMNSSGRVCRHCLLMYFRFRQIEGSRGDSNTLKYSLDDITGNLWPLHCETNMLTHRKHRRQNIPSCNRSSWPLSVGRPATDNQRECEPKPPKNKLTISPGSTHSLAIECGQQGCMGVAPLPLEIKWWWTSGMPVARMWEPILSWDALPLQWFPEYQVLGNPPWFK